jgi:hypothetical protein
VRPSSTAARVCEAEHSAGKSRLDVFAPRLSVAQIGLPVTLVADQTSHPALPHRSSYPHPFELAASPYLEQPQAADALDVSLASVKRELRAARTSLAVEWTRDAA